MCPQNVCAQQPQVCRTGYQDVHTSIHRQYRRKHRDHTRRQPTVNVTLYELFLYDPQLQLAWWISSHKWSQVSTATAAVVKRLHSAFGF